MKYNYIAVILVYRNVEDLVECIDSIREKIYSCRIVVVNSYFDDESLNKIKTVAENKDCDFIGIENRGYGYGNNKGIEFAISNYEFDYVIVSNPDIIIKKFNETVLHENRIYAPRIVSKSGREQNPMVIKHNRLSEYMLYRGFKQKSRLLLIFGYAFFKIAKNIQSLFIQEGGKIYQAHGSFVILHRNVIDKLHPIYDTNMFLFGEEGVMALKARKFNIETIFVPDIEIFHKEDGSMRLADFSIDNELSKSNIYFFEKYVFKN